MLISRHVRILEKHLKILYPNLNIAFHVSRRSKYVHMGLDSPLFTLKVFTNIISEIKDFMSEDLDKRFSIVCSRLVHTVCWKYDYIVFKKQN